ncbi:MAG: helix-turn-helix domain-containing protein [Pseudomonadota bacterium]
MRSLTQVELAERWRMSPRTLEQWRWRGVGPRYLKIGGRVIYPLAFVEAYEAGQVHQNTNGPLPQEG